MLLEAGTSASDDSKRGKSGASSNTGSYDGVKKYAEWFLEGGGLAKGVLYSASKSFLISALGVPYKD